MIQLLLLALVPLALAQYGGHDDNGHVEQHWSPQPYKFGYDVKDHHGSSLEQKEEGDSHGNKRGSYGYTDGHGIYRQVDYVADKGGFRATIKTNEPGTTSDDPADVHIDSNARHTEYRSEPKMYKQESYSAPSYRSYKPQEKRQDNYGMSSSSDGYAKSQSMPALYWSEGY